MQRSTCVMGEGCDGILLKVQRLWLLKQGGTAGISVYYCLYYAADSSFGKFLLTRRECK